MLYAALSAYLIGLTLADNYLDKEEGSARLQNACNDLPDGEHWVRLRDDTYYDPITQSDVPFPNVRVRCHDGWTIIDYELHTLVEKYFSSFGVCTEYVASSALADRVSWDEWWLPSSYHDNKVDWHVSTDCQTCDNTEYSNLPTPDFDENKATYYMTGNYIGCLWMTKGVCDMDTQTLQCYECAADVGGAIYSGLCTHMVWAADTPVYKEHDLCVQDSFNAVPALGTDGRYCQCFKPDSAGEVDAAEWVEEEDDEEEVRQSPDTIIEMWAKDFEEGSYIINEPGTYILMEDVIMDCNGVGPDEWDFPNAPDKWWPRIDQNDVYEGSYGFVGAYSMGFFAGIAISTTDVTIDLGGHELAQSELFRLQQRWFSTIEIGSKAFISGQGPGNFGAFLTGCENIVIKNGILGLTSHHAIHSNFASNVEIRDLIIRDFEVAGIAMNGYRNLIMDNLDIGPSDTNVPVLGCYTQARTLLPRLRAIYENDPSGSVHFANRPGELADRSVEDLTNELELQMDMVFHYLVEDKQYSLDDERWNKAYKLFVNELKVPSASTVYGIFMNAEGASVFAIAGAPGESKNAVVTNIRIHDLMNDPWEVPRVMNTKGPMNDIFDITKVGTNGLHDFSTSVYTGNAYTDCQYALYKTSEDWAVLAHASFKESVDNWISQGVPLDPKSSPMKCNNDIMLHVTKGVFGLRVDSAKGFRIENVVVEELHNIGIYGDTVCGDYESEIDGGHRNQKWPLQHGFTGTETHAFCIVNSWGEMHNIRVSHIYSARGDAFGMQIFPGNDIVMGKVEINDIHAGAYAGGDALWRSNVNTFPNKVPRGCGLTLWTWFSEDEGTPYAQTHLKFTGDQINVQCVSGLRHCDESPFDFEMSPVLDCSREDGNVLDAHEIRGGYVYADAGDRYSHIVKMLDKQKKRIPGHLLHGEPESYLITILVTTVAMLSLFFVTRFLVKKCKEMNKVSGIQSSEATPLISHGRASNGGKAMYVPI